MYCRTLIRRLVNQYKNSKILISLQSTKLSFDVMCVNLLFYNFPTPTSKIHIFPFLLSTYGTRKLSNL